MLVVAVLLVLLGNLRAGLIVALAIPLSMLFAGNLMLYFGIAGSLMSLGAIDFGLIVDSAVIVIENCVSRLAHADPAERGRSTWSAARRWRSAGRSSSAWRSSRMVHLPILALEGVEGKMFRPMALTVIFALTGSLLLSLTATPVLASFFLRPGIVGARDAGRSAWAKRVYEPVLRLVAAASRGGRARGRRSAFAACVPVALGLGGEFIPQLDEGDLIIAADRPPERLARRGDRRRRRGWRRPSCEAFPDEIRTVVSRIGRPEIGLEAGGRQPDRHLGPPERARAVDQGPRPRPS